MTMSPTTRQQLVRLVQVNKDLAYLLNTGASQSATSKLIELESRTNALLASVLNESATEAKCEEHRQAIKDLSNREGPQRLAQLIRLPNLKHLEPVCRLAVVQTAYDLMIEVGASIPTDWATFLKTDGLLDTDTMEEILNV